MKLPIFKLPLIYVAPNFRIDTAPIWHVALKISDILIAIRINQCSMTVFQTIDILPFEPPPRREYNPDHPIQNSINKIPLDYIPVWRDKFSISALKTTHHLPLITRAIWIHHHTIPFEHSINKSAHRYGAVNSRYCTLHQNSTTKHPRGNVSIRAKYNPTTMLVPFLYISLISRSIGKNDHGPPMQHTIHKLSNRYSAISTNDDTIRNNSSFINTRSQIAIGTNICSAPVH